MNQRLTASQAEKTKKITMIGLMTAVTCILGPLSLPLPFSPVPITLTNFAVFLSIYILGMKYGTNRIQSLFPLKSLCLSGMLLTAYLLKNAVESGEIGCKIHQPLPFA